MTKPDMTSEFMRQASADLETFMYNSLRDLPDQTSMYGHAARYAAVLGHQPESFPPFQGVEIKSSAAADMYVPGVVEIDDPNDHIRGLASTILRAPLTVSAKTELLDRMVVLAADKRVHDRPKSVKHYRSVVGEEINAHYPPVSGQRLSGLPTAIHEKWHPTISRRLQASWWIGSRLLPKIER